MDEVRNKIVRSETFPQTRRRQRQEEDAGDASTKALWPLFVKIQPALSSLLRDLADWNAERQSQEESVQTAVEDPSLMEDVADSHVTEALFCKGGNRFDYIRTELPLYQAGLKGDWQAAKAILDKHPEFVRKPITEGEEYILHVAVLANRYTFVKEVLELMSPEDLELKEASGCTALHCAAQSSINLEIVEELVKKNNKLPLIRTVDGKALPLLLASNRGKRDIVSFLVTATPFEDLSATDRIDILFAIISADLYDIAWKFLQRDETLATAEDSNGRIALQVLAEKPFAVGSRSQMSAWERCFSWYKGTRNKAFLQTSAHQLVARLWKNIQILPSKKFSDLVEKHSSLFLVAAKSGNVEFLTIIFQSYPELVKMVDRDNRSLFQIAILYRQESVFNLIYELGGLKDIFVLWKGANNNNMLHDAGQLAPLNRVNVVSGAALQMQRELLWFKEIGKIMPRDFLSAKNLEGQTPQDIFTETHKDLRRNGEEWMKATSNCCMLVATLIATVVFAALFTIPGENQQENGTPIHLGRNWFTAFYISDIISFLSSSSAILIFLSILISRYKEEDFLKSLPGRLLIGLIALLLSVVGMVVAFSATCFLVYKTETARIPIVIFALASVPIILFVWLNYDLWVDIICATYWSRFLFGPRKRGLF